MSMLDGVRVLDLTQYLSGPSCTLLLAGLGADVIKVEPGPVGDLSRLLPLVKDKTSSYYAQQNRGKRSMCVDFAHPDTPDLLRALAGESDVLIENFSLGVMDKRGLGPDELRAEHPELIYVSISAYGRSGSRAHLPGYDLIGQAVAGSVALTGEPDGAPFAPGVPIADMAAGYMAFGAIGHALFTRERTGEGQFLDVSMVEAIFQMHPFAVQGPSQTEDRKRLKPSGRHFGSVPPAGTYAGPDGWLVLQVLDAQWPRLCEAAADIGLGEDERFATPRDRSIHRDELVDALEAWMQTFPDNPTLMAHLEAYRLPAAEVVDPADAHLDPWFRERGVVTEIDDPFLGNIRVPGFPLHGSAIPEIEQEPAVPRLGEHNAQVLHELLGMDETSIKKLEADGVLLAPEPVPGG